MIEEEKITYHSEDVEFELERPDIYTTWLLEIGKVEQVDILGLTFVFCSDEYLLAINREYLDHDYYTDIITFPYKQGKEVESDLFISVDRVSDNAATLGIDTHAELLRVMAHGLLHLCGYGDKSEAEAVLMREKEEQCLQLWK